MTDLRFFVRRFSRWVYWLDAGAILFSASICATAWLTYCATCSFDSDIACVLFSIAEPRRVMSTLRIPEHDVAANAIAASAASERKFFFIYLEFVFTILQIYKKKDKNGLKILSAAYYGNNAWANLFYFYKTPKDGMWMMIG